MASRQRGSGDNASTPEGLIEAEVRGARNEALTETRREQICDAALELFLEKGFASTTIRDICARSGVNQASIYDYIANKNDILRRLLNRLWFDHDVPSLAERLSEQDDRALTDIIADYLRDTWTHKRQGTLLVYRSVPYLQADDRRTMRARDEAVIATLAARLRERAGLPEDDRRAEVMANLIIFISAFGPMRDWLGNDIDDGLMLRTVAAGVAAMIKELGRDLPTG
ncbi:TetR/AcrR family transcriptional regulator [Alloalcanivorax sp. C16-2]|uniref:TetR/AcrR family transcriptional regulator n=1 Tax=Alloalcanivorax TaxID=3020832 RepID=UPI001EE3CB61|nr:TetR/AcrR family transcriptional regulator [Alloalcanivorax marinus]